MNVSTRGPARVLIVEDEFMIAMEIESVVLDAGFDVLGPAADVESALALIDASSPDIGLLDVNLGHGTTSTPVAERLTEVGVPFILCTGYQTADLVQSYGEGIPMLQKPVDTVKLVEFLRTLAPASRR
jgi:two-component system, response regulator PdtaR